MVELLPDANSKNTAQTLVEIAPPAFDVAIDLAYATPRNITGQPIYARAACYLHGAAATCLARAVELAAAQGLKLLIFDAYRPVEAQWRLWETCPDPTFLADPRRGSPHSRGIAVDLTLIDAGDSTPLEMGTGFDDLTPRAFHGNNQVSPRAQRNRMQLLGLMASAGWDHYLNEWWHYQLYQPRRFPLLWDSAAGTRMMGEP
jgi:D-alanyl-D-alanine dipeptidase